LGGTSLRKRPEPEVLRAEVHVHGGGAVRVIVGEMTEKLPRAELRRRRRKNYASLL